MALNLAKGQKISLNKEAGSTLTQVTMGLGWDPVKKGGMLGGLFGSGGGSIDLDASCVMFDDKGKAVDIVWFRQLKSRDGSIIHTGDNLTGEGEGDDEQIIVNLEKVPEHIKTLVFTVNSFTGQTFDNVDSAYCRMVDSKNNKEIARFTLSGKGNHSAQIMAKVYRHEGEWKMHAIGENGFGRTIETLMPEITKYL